MFYKNLNEEEKAKKETFMKMTNQEYDKYMVLSFPELFRDRKLPMTQTCMCWGFNIGEGWHYLLFDLCDNLNYIRQKTGIITVFDQIKEKYGGGRFYYHLDTSNCKMDDKDRNLWCELIRYMVSEVERESDEICAACGESYYKKITLDGWIYDVCKECLIKEKGSDISKDIEYMEKIEETIEKINWKMSRLNDDQLSEVEKVVEKFCEKTIEE